MTTTIDTRKIAGQAGYIAGGRLGGAMIQALSLALLARVLGPSDFGAFAVWYGLAVVLQAFVNFGLTPLLVRVRAQGGRDSDVLRMLFLCGIASAVVAVVVTTFASVSAIFFEAKWYLVPLGIWVVADNLVETYLAIPLADGRAWQNAISLVYRRSISVVVLLIGMVLDADVALFYASGLALGSLTVFLFVLKDNSQRLSGDQSQMTFGSLAAEAKYFWINSIATQARNLDVFVVSIVATGSGAGSTTGYYAAASRLTSPLRIVPTSFASVLMPAAVRSAKDGKYRGLVRATVLISLVSAVGFLIVALLVPLLVPIVLGESYDGAVTVIQIVCGGLVFAAVSSQLNAVLQAIGRARLVSNVSLVSTVACLLLVALLVPSAGAAGAGWGLAISYVVQFLILTFATWKTVRGARR